MASASDDYSGVAHQGTILCEKCNYQHVYQMDSPPNLRLLQHKTPHQVSVTRRFKINICSKCMGNYGTNYLIQNLRNLKGMFDQQYARYQANLKNGENNMTERQVPFNTRSVQTGFTNPTDEEKRKLLLRNAPLPEYQGRKIFITNNNVFVRENRPVVMNRSQTPLPPPSGSAIMDSDEDEDEEDDEDDDCDEDDSGNIFNEADYVDDSEEEVDIL
jgi:hypothetical protein